MSFCFRSLNAASKKREPVAVNPHRLQAVVELQSEPCATMVPFSLLKRRTWCRSVNPETENVASSRKTLLSN